MPKSIPTSISERLNEFSSYSELKQVAYSIATLQQEKLFHSLAVLSFFPGEGKTLFCAAIAKAYAETCRTRVMVVDTTTFQTKGSLVLRDCLVKSHPQVEVVSLDELRSGSHGANPLFSNGFPPAKGPALEPEIVQDSPVHVPVAHDNDFSLIKRMASEQSKKFGLILFDSSPLTTKNRNNMDPWLMARLSDASLLVVSRKLLKASDLRARLKSLEDPALHLIGLVSNEVH